MPAKKTRKLPDRLSADALVIGSGVAGLSAALHLLDAGWRVALVARTEPLDSNTALAQGGIVTRGPADSPGALVGDILRTGEGLGLPEAARIVAAEGPDAVETVLQKRAGVPFARAGRGFDYTKEGAHSRRRILHVDDATGKAIAEHLLAAVCDHPRLTLLAHHTAVDLITLNHQSRDPLKVYDANRCLGAYCLDNRSGRVRTLFAPAVVLATGGAGRVWLHTTNPEGARGDGLAMAYRAFVPIINAEYMQFHPTTLFHRDSEGFLISESLRGEGARLLTRDGRPFMQRYHALGDLAPRDVVSRAIYQEMLSRGDSYVLLDATAYRGHIPLKERFPTISAACGRFGFDIATEPIPVVPAAHYHCGGVKVDLDARTPLSGLWAVGEVACTGLHGANRLASTSLLEGLVFGGRCARSVCAARSGAKETWRRAIPDVPDWEAPRGAAEPDPALLIQDSLLVRSTMWNYAGILRTHDRLHRAQSDINYLRHRAEKFYKEAKVTDALLGLRNKIQVAQMIIGAAIRNPVSRGCHFIEKER
jgi:L-aspartate oxidase